MNVGLIQARGFVRHAARADFNSSLAQMRKPTTRNLRVWIFYRRYHTLHPSINQSVGARGSATVMSMRLERNEGRTAARPSASLFQRQRLCMLHVIVKIETFARDLTARIDNDCAHQRPGTNLGHTSGREFQG